MMDYTEIHLSNNAETLKEIYFPDKSHRYFFGPKTIRQSIYFLLGLIGFYLWVKDLITKEFHMYNVIGILICSYLIYDYFRMAYPKYKWKKSIDEFIQTSSKITDLRLQYNNDFFTHFQDKDSMQVEWTSITQAIINEKFISLRTETNHFLLPRGAMKEEEFQSLSEVVKSRVENYET